MKKSLLIIPSLMMVITAVNPNSFSPVHAEELEHTLSLTGGVVKMGGTYGTQSAYYKVKGSWVDSTGSDYMSGGFIVNKTPTTGSINMAYTAISESYTPSSGGKAYGAIRTKKCDIPRIGTGTDLDGFIEHTKTSSSGKMWSEICGGPVLLRYDSEAQKRTLPSSYAIIENRYVAKGSVASYTTVTSLYQNFEASHFGIGWYYGTYTCDLTNICIYDDNYNSLGLAVDSDASPEVCALYGKENERIYVDYSDVDAVVEGVKATNNGHKVEITGIRNEGNNVFSFIMPNENVTVSPELQKTAVNISINGQTYHESIEWSKENLETAINNLISPTSSAFIVGYRYNNKLFDSVDALVSSISKESKKASYDITVEQAELLMNSNASFRTVIGSSGLRFTGRVKGSVSEYGMIVTKYNKLESLEKFTMEDMPNSDYRKVSSLNDGFNFYVENGYNVFSSVIVNMKEENILQEYIARLYCKVTYENETVKTFYSYIDDSYKAIPYEAGLIAASQIDQDTLANPNNKDINNLRKDLINKYYDPVCNIDNSYHLIGNGRNYTVEKVENEEGKIRIIPLNEYFKVTDIKYLCINGISIPYTSSNSILSFSAGYINKMEFTNPLNGGEIDITHSIVKNYLKLTDESEEAKYLKTYTGSAYNGQRLDQQVNKIEWKQISNDIDTYLVYVSEDPTFLNTYTFATNKSYLTPGCLTPGKTYYVKVATIINGKVLTQSDVDSFTVLDDTTVRIINANGAANVRDEGGWLSDTGKRVKYNLLYRGGCINGHGGYQLNKNGLYMFNNILNMKSEIDLRVTNSDDVDSSGKPQTSNFFDSNNLYVKSPILPACYIIPGWSQTSPMSRSYYGATVSSFKAIFSTLANEDNYPVYFHCNGGADRTGTLGYLILGLLGVDITDLYRDIELTSFSPYGGRWRSNIVDGEFTADGVMEDDSNNYVAFGKMHSLLMEKYATADGKVSSMLENYLVNGIGVPQSDIDNLRSILLG